MTIIFYYLKPCQYSHIHLDSRSKQHSETCSVLHIEVQYHICEQGVTPYNAARVQAYRMRMRIPLFP